MLRTGLTFPEAALALAVAAVSARRPALFGHGDLGASVLLATNTLTFGSYRGYRLITMDSRGNWVTIVGFRHEVVHTSVLRFLLEDRAIGPALAQELTGADVAEVQSTRQESKVLGFSGKADMVAEIRLSTGETVTLAIETKVDSDGTRGQLRATATPPHFGVLFTVGLTAFKLGQPEFDPDLPNWRAVGPRAWLRPAEWRRLDGVQRYLEFMCFSQSRYLSLKAGANVPGQLGSVPQDLWDVAKTLGWRAPLRRAGARAKSCTAAWLDLTTYTPAEATERARSELDSLSRVLAQSTSS